MTREAQQSGRDKSRMNFAVADVTDVADLRLNKPHPIVKYEHSNGAVPQ
jgi:hypothetical protein